MHAVVTTAFHDELGKIAALKEVVRILAKDIPRTPRLVMKHRMTAQRAALGEAAEAGWKKRLTDPMMKVFDKGLKKLPEGRAKKALTWTAETIAKDPFGGAVTALAPGGLAVPVIKRGLRRAINVLDPV